MKKSNMASVYSLLFSVFVFLLVTMNELVEAGKEFKVGYAEGWRVPGEKNTAFYKQWAAKADIRVGDSLRFEYEHDSVLVVDKWGYYHCNISKPISTFKDGNTLFKLTKPGPMFFISGNKDHCDKGQRLAIDVVALHPSNPPPRSAGEESVSVKLVTICLAFVATSVALA